MSFFPPPNISREKIKGAGDRLRDDTYTDLDIDTLERWRACHLYILNTFQSNLRARAKKFGKKVVVAQRLKRRSTIIDKLRRQTSMQLSRMQDLVGCRVIFNNLDDLYNYRSSIEAAKFKHERRHDRSKYDYIDHPKSTGYRGIHDVYHYVAATVSGSKWNGLCIEIQYRTIHQHAWAAAVEVVDLITMDRIKFDETTKSHREFFCLSSEILSRHFEGRTSCAPTLTTPELLSKFQEAEEKTSLLSTLNSLSKSKSRVRNLANTLLIITGKKESKPDLKIETFKTIFEAAKKYNEYETNSESLDIIDVVFVRGMSEEDMALAYSNYFSDTANFCKFMKTSISALSTL